MCLHLVACYSAASLGLGLGFWLELVGWLVSGYAHAFTLLSVAIVTLPHFTHHVIHLSTTLETYRREADN